jgi:conjugative transfer ATPase
MSSVVEQIKKWSSSPLGTKCSEIFNQYLGSETPEAFHSIADRRDLYKEAESFASFLPYAEWLEDESMMLMDDLVSVGAAWEVDMAPSEAIAESVLDDIEEACTGALSRVTQEYLSDGQYVLSSYTGDDYDLGRDLSEIEASIHPAWKNSALAKAYLSSLERMFRGLESPEGLFLEGNGRVKRPFRGGRRVPKILLYRRVPLSKRNGKEQIREKEIESLDVLRMEIEEAFSGVGIHLKRMKRESFYEFMVRWFNPKPASTNGDVNALLRINPCPPKELSSLESELPLSFLFNTPKTDSENGVIEFDGCPSRYIQVDRMSRIPQVAALTGEKSIEIGGKNEQLAMFDLLPSGTMFVKHIFFQAQDECEKRVKDIEEKSQFIDNKAKLVNKEAEKTLEVMASGSVLLKVEMGFFTSALTLKRLDQKSRQISGVAANRLGLGVIEPKNNLFPVESYLRNLPFVTDPMLDRRRKRGRLSWLDFSVSLLPLIGRSRGNDHHKDKRCMTMFNRGGEVLNIDMMNKEANAHTVLLGPTGTGKSATLNKMICELLLFHNARLVIAEAGMSFDPIMDFLEAQRLDVQRININPGAMGKPIAPFMNARKARDKVLEEMSKNGTSQDTVVESLMGNIPEFYWNLHTLATEEPGVEGDGHLEDKRKEAKHRVEEVVAELVKEFDREADDSGKAFEKDYFGECVMIAKIMVTGGDIKEEQKFRLRDETHLGDAILEAVTIADTMGEELVRPEHVYIALRNRANNDKLGLDDGMRARLNEMADIMKRYTTSVRGDVLNKQATGFNKVDCLHVEIGIGQREGYEDLLCLSYLSLLNQINDIAERKELEGDERPIIVITDEAHLIMNHPMLAPVAIKIVRMWRKYGAWFLAATQETKSFKGGAEAILAMAEMFFTLCPPEEEVEQMTKILKLSDEKASLLRAAKMVKQSYTEGVYLNRSRKTGTLFRVLQPSFCLSVAGTDDKEKLSRQETMKKYEVRMAGACMIEAAKIDYARRLITKEQLEQEVESICRDPVYRKAA